MDLLGGYESSDSDVQQGDEPAQHQRSPPPAPGPGPGGEEEEEAACKRWSAIPAPKLVKRRVVLPIHKALLDSLKGSDDDEPQPAKRIKPTPGEYTSHYCRPCGASVPPLLMLAHSTPGTSKLMEFLPPPKNELPLPGSLGGFASSSQASQRTAAASSGGLQGAGSLPTDFFQPAAGPSSAVAEVASGNELYRADLEGGAGPSAYHPAPPPHDHYYDASSSAGLQQQPQGAHHVGGYGGGGGEYAAAAEPGTAGVDMFEKALQEERERAIKQGRGVAKKDVQFVEIKQKELTYMDPAAIAAQDSIRKALGSEYARTWGGGAGWGMNMPIVLRCVCGVPCAVLPGTSNFTPLMNI